MSKESVAEDDSTTVSGWVASAHKHDAFKVNPLLVARAPETILLCDLSQEGDNGLSAILVSLWQIDLITENNEPLVSLKGSHN